jgi:small subunit ribosomal protein S2
MASETKPEAPAAQAGAAKPETFQPSPIQMKDLIEAGLHFGHQTRRWNPKMRPMIYGIRGGVHIIDLQQTIRLFRRAYGFVVETVARGGHIMMVGTKRQAQDIVAAEAQRAKMFHVTTRWIGGLLTNYKTVSLSLETLNRLNARFAEEGGFKELKKKEVLRLAKEQQRLEKNFGGVKAMRQLPAAVFIIDSGHEATAIREANKMSIPVIALVDTNCDPDPIDYIIPGNDDAIKSIQYVTARIADACLEGLHKRMEVMGRYGTETEGLVSPAPKEKAGAGPTVEYAQRKSG